MAISKKKNQNKTKDILIDKISPLVGFAFVFFPIVMSFISPEIAGLYLIVFFTYFVYKSAATATQFGLGLYRIRNNEQINWIHILNALENPKAEEKKLEAQIEQIKKMSWEDYRKQKSGVYKKLESLDPALYATRRLPKLLRHFVFWRQKRKVLNFMNKEFQNLRRVNENGILCKPSELDHVFIIPFVNEPAQLVHETMDCLRDQTIDTKRITVVLASEAAVPEGEQTAKKVKEKYQRYFNDIWITAHVKGPGEIVGKSSNMNWAARKAYENIKELGWDLEKTTVTSCDVDSKIDPQYFANVSYLYLTGKESKYKFFVSAIIFYNNIWRLPFYARVKNSFSSIYNVSKLPRTDKLAPFSTYTTSFWNVKEIGFWDPWVTPEDYHLYFKSIFTHPGKVSAIPIYLKTMADSAEGIGHINTAKNNYKQSRRWAWGISDHGWMLKNLYSKFFRLSMVDRYKVFHAIWDQMLGPTIAMLVLLGGNIPVWLNADFGDTTFGAALPDVATIMIRSTLLFLLVMIILDFYLRPSPDDKSFKMKVMRIVEWFFQPISGFLLASLPGLEAQTRLIFTTQYLEHEVQEKHVEGKE